MRKLLEKRPILTITAVALLLLLPNLNALEVSIMEARNFISAREMLTDGNWILTTLNGQARYQKPPLPTWLTALSALVFGIENVWALRLPAALMVVFLGVGVFKLSRKLSLSNLQSIISGLVVITSLYTILIIFEAPWDIFAHTFMLWSIYFLVCWIKNESLFRSGFLFIVFVAASILSKGPVSLYVLFLSFLVAYFISFNKVLSARRIGYLTGLLLLGLIAGFSWYGYVRWVDAETFVRITTKETGNWSSYNVRPFYYYWSFFVQSGMWTIPALVSLLYPYLNTRVSNRKVYRFALLWVLIAVVLLSIIPEKKSRYLMPVLIPMSLTIGFYIKYMIDHFNMMKDWREKVSVYFHFGVIGVVFTIGVGAFFVTSNVVNIPWYSYLFLFFAALAGIFIIRELLTVREIFNNFLLSILGLLLVVFGIDRALKNNLENENYRHFNTLEIQENLKMYAYNVTIPELVWEYGDKIPVLDDSSLMNDQLGSEFLILGSSSTGYNVPSNFKHYEFQLKDSINLNQVKPKNRNYKMRKKALIYLATRK